MVGAHPHDFRLRACCCAAPACKSCSRHDDWKGLMCFAGNVNTVAEFQANVLPFKGS